MFGISSNPLEVIFLFISLLVAITVHEFSHAYTADRLGDPTPRLMGRLTLNPLKHLDIIGTIMILIANFGWGKPVVFDPYNLKNPRRDSAIISLAGPVSNFFVAIICAILVHLLFTFRLTLLFNSGIGVFVYVFNALLQSIIVLNIMLGVFNLVPIHPLDGFKIVEGILPEKYAGQWKELERYGFIFLLFLVFPILGPVSPISRVISPVIRFLQNILLP
jgi:Zn-dependent protease